MLIHDIALSLAPGVGLVTARRLMDFFGSSEAALEASAEQLEQIGGLRRRLIDNRWNTKMLLARARTEFDMLVHHGAKAISIPDEEYPSQLRECRDAPLVLYVKGNTDFNRGKWVAIVGTRKVSSYGLDACDRIIKEIAEKHPDTVIVSGLAYGVDIATHKAAMKYGLATVGVIARGVDRVYPSAHTRYAEDMIHRGGAIVSEIVIGAEPEAPNFLQRNRIIAGMCEATIVIESAIRGGSLNTANVADSYDRAVFALPGRMTDASSVGTNHLIKTQRAYMYQDVSDLEYQLQWNDESIKDKAVRQLSLFTDLTPEQKTLLENMPSGEICFDELLERCYNSDPSRISELNLSLMQLELSGLIKALPCKMYIRL